MGNPVDIIKDVGLNLMTGGLYSVGKAVKKTIETGNPMHLLSQGLDLGVAAIGNELAVAIGGPGAGMAFNMAGLGLGMAGAAGAFSGLPGFAPGGAAAIAPAAAAPVGTAASGSEVIGAANAGTLASAAPSAAAPAAAIGTPAAGSEVIGAVNAPVVSATNAAAPELAKQAITQIPLGAESNPAALKAWFDSQTPEVQATLTNAVGGGGGGGSDLLKYGGLMVGGQMLTGALGGIFEGVSAEKKLALENLINSQRQNQVQYLNKNNQYTPLLKFNNPHGTLNTPRVV